jgi:polyphosphate glucokinase
MQVLGIDIGGSGVKGAPVDTERGELLAERLRIATPVPSSPQAVADVVAQIQTKFTWNGPIGCGFPAVVKHGVTMTAANVDSHWIGLDAAGLFAKTTGCPTVVLNDADAAGIAEMTFGAGRGVSGVVLIITIGTGLGTCMFIDGRLVPNLELGHIEIRGKDAERRASDAARKRKKLSWDRWARRFDEYLLTLERLLWPDLILLSGGASKDADKFLPHLTVKTKIVVAQLLNNAGIVGAALAARQLAQD